MIVMREIVMAPAGGLMVVKKIGGVLQRTRDPQITPQPGTPTDLRPGVVGMGVSTRGIPGGILKQADPIITPKWVNTMTEIGGA